MRMQQWDTEDVETVAGVVRLLRRAAELSWTQADAGGPRSPHQLFAVGIDAAADEAANLLPRRVRLDGPTPVGQTRPSFWDQRSNCCVDSAPRIHSSRLRALHSRVSELVWEANSGADA